MERTRALFKKIGDIKGTFHARMDMIEDRNGKDLMEAEEVKKRWQEYTEDQASSKLRCLSGPHSSSPRGWAAAESFPHASRSGLDGKAQTLSALTRAKMRLDYFFSHMRGELDYLNYK